MRYYIYVLIHLFLCLSVISTCYGQKNSYSVIVNSIATKLENILGYKYEVSGIDVDKTIKDPSSSDTKINDIYRTLADCFIFMASGESSLDTIKGLIGVYKIKSDSILWKSIPLPSDFSSDVLGRISEVREINRDGKDEIVIAEAKGAMGILEQLWIFNWDGLNGNLITQLDKNGESTILVSEGSYRIKDIDGDGIYEILGKDSDSDKTLTYSWNGSLYGKWGKASKYLLKGRRK